MFFIILNIIFSYYTEYLNIMSYIGNKAIEKYINLQTNTQS